MTYGHQFKTCVFGLAVVGLAAFTSLDTQAAITYQKVALTGDAAPGVAPGAVFTGVNPFPGMNNLGQAAFSGSFAVPGDPSVSGNVIWAGVPGGLRVVAQSGQQAPGAASGVQFSGLNRYPVINDVGQVSIFSTLTGPGIDDTNNQGIWSEGSGSLQLVARTGDPAAGMNPGVIYTDLNNFFDIATMNELGQSVFRAELSGPGIVVTNNTGIWSGYAGVVNMLVQVGDPAPGTEAGTVFSATKSAPVLTPLGQTIFEGTLTGPSIDETNDTGIWKAGSGQLDLFIREGDAAPDLQGGVTFNLFFRSQSNGAGEVAFLAGIEGPGVTDGIANGNGFWSEGGGELHLVARAGDPAPGTNDVYGPMHQIVINEAGQTVYTARLSSGINTRGMWLETNGVSQLIARTGENAPGTDPGVAFKGFNGSNGQQINSAGQVAFRGELTGTGVDTSNDWGLWATDPLGNLTKIVREGELFDVNDDPFIEDLRTITRADMLLTGNDGTHNGTPASFNDAGQILMHLSFDDNSGGLFIANTRIPGDLDGDGFVGINDLNLVLGNWNQNVPPADPSADPSGDGFIGIDDLNTVLGNWNTGTPPTLSVPEPGALAVWAVALCTSMRRRPSVRD